MFLNPLGLLALIGVPAVIGLHLFRRRFRRQPVSAVFLWEAADRSPVAGRQREPLRTNPSFWCELAAALLLALAIAGLRAFGAGDARHLVVVLDASASMAAVTGEGSLRESGLELVRERVAALPRGSRVTLVASGPRPTLLAGPAAFPGEALAKADAWRPAFGRHDLTPAVALAQQLAGDGRVLLVTDHYRPEDWPEAVELVALGAPTDNLALVHATRRRVTDEASGERRTMVHVTVANFGFASREARLELSAEGAPLGARAVTLAPGERKHVSFTLPADAPALEARLPADALPVDDVAWLAAEPPRTLALATTLPADLARFLGIASGRGDTDVDRWLALVPDSVAAPDPALAHLVIGEAVAPGRAWCLSLEGAGEARTHLVGPFLADKQHPLLTGVTLEGIVWSASDELALRGAPLVSAGDRPLLTEGLDGERVLYRANLDPRASSLHRSPDWPILLANLAELRRRELPGPARTSLAVGEAFTYRDRGPARYRLSGPRGPQSEARELKALGTLTVEDVERPGLYTLERLEEDGRATLLCEVAWSFVDAAESDLRGLASGRREATSSLAEVLAGFTWMEVALLAAVLGLVVLDWWVLGGRRRSGGSA